MNAKTIACLSGILMFAAVGNARAGISYTYAIDTGSGGAYDPDSVLVYDFDGVAAITGTNVTEGVGTYAKSFHYGNFGYVSASATTFTVAGGTSYFGIGWGTVDGDNTISFYADAAGTQLIATYTASDLFGSDANRTNAIYANFTSDVPIVTVVLSTTRSSYLFEYDNLRISAVPLPGALALFGFGLGGLGLTGWRKRRKA